MKIPKLYLETSVLNFVFADDSPDKRADTIKLFEDIKNGKYVPFTSDYVMDEIDNTPDFRKREELNKLILEYEIKRFQKTDEIRHLAEEYVKEGVIPEKYVTDALHIATAAVNDLDIIISWNFKHIVKKKTIVMTELVNQRNGYKKIEICSPTEVIENGI
jgi:predicted nucleic acid-binding protein